MTLKEFFTENTEVALGFSGGVDSSYLLYAALKFGAKVKAYFVKTAFQPEFELKDAYRLANHVGAEITVLEKDIFDNAQVISNPLDRCYYCKKAIFGAILKQALADQVKVIIDGTNLSDDATDRPGMRAIEELSVRSPLRECGFSKSEVRRLSKDAGLFTWNKPAYACLATRIPAGREITKDLLLRIECAENSLFELGYTDFRVRILDEAAKLQFPQDQINSVIHKRDEIIKSIKPYFQSILLDLEGR